MINHTPSRISKRYIARTMFDLYLKKREPERIFAQKLGKVSSNIK